jgi:hypothetical protein
MSAVKNYDPAQVQVIFFGIKIGGFADGTFVVVARENPSFTSVVGSDGEGARAKSNDRSGSVTITLLQTSDSNDALSVILNADELSGDGVGSLMVKDSSGRLLVNAETAWLEKPSDAEFAREISNREWVIKTNELTGIWGGNVAA